MNEGRCDCDGSGILGGRREIGAGDGVSSDENGVIKRGWERWRYIEDEIKLHVASKGENAWKGWRRPAKIEECKSKESRSEKPGG